MPDSPEDLLANAAKPAGEALRLHPYYRGKIQTTAKCAIRDLNDFAIWYTPGVAASCKAIQANPAEVYEHTNRANTIAIVTDGTRVLGLGDIGPAAGLPVMEGKALLFKYLGGVDAVPICLDTKDPGEIVRTVELLQPSFGGINLEDISQPKCFRILDSLRESLEIPVWHDDQQGTAVVALAALINALEVVGKDLESIRIAMIGMGAANVATYRLLATIGVDPGQVTACDSRGILGRHRTDLEAAREEYPDKWRVCGESNPGDLEGGIPEALENADVCIAFSVSRPGLIQRGWIEAMKPGAVVFACANPVPEIWPWEAGAAGAAVVATGRGDFPNQLNNSLSFPGIFRGVLDVRASAITDEMAIAAARELASFAKEGGLSPGRILPTMDDWEVFPRVAGAVAAEAQRLGLAALGTSPDEVEREAAATISRSRDSVAALMREGLIPSPPDEE